MLQEVSSSIVAETDYDQQSQLLASKPSLRRALVDLFLSVKIRTNEEIDGYDKDKLSNERVRLHNEQKICNLTLLEYIKTSIEILMNMKSEEFFEINKRN